MSYTREDYLRVPNPSLFIYERRSTFTQNRKWAPIDSIQMWDEFSSFLDTYRERLNRAIEPDSLISLSEETAFNRIYDEAGLTLIHGTSIIMPVCKALPDDTYVTTGGEMSTLNPDLRPDWGATRVIDGSPRHIVCGETKIGWDVVAAVKMIQRHPDGYDNAEGADLALPFEQLQHYCLGFNVPFGFILTEEYLVCCQITLEPDIKRSPRPKRTTAKYRHNRMQSSSTTSTGLETSLSDMSFEPSSTFRNVGPMKVAIDRWSPLGQTGELPIKVSLWLLIMKARNHNGLKVEDTDDQMNVYSEGQGASQRKEKGKRRERY
ncbi:hypothetical protein EYB26_005298 [Talaromyces marneffei]|uniref:uncharacterized protein n=1 Tax=Talaromyces marneffei TaxID=37727 RepID=UPI0012A98730|nr:uncharacterized protein EYB26_005298 [Talaromyces marneffei]QGA17623.1 hypothetical protein EYB26_005298 [Talaromyces marneffei]